jgi:Flp pilus assembly protein CpaB
MARTGPSPFAEVTRVVSWHRRKLAVLAAMAAAATGITAATPDPPPTTSVVVAGHRLVGGSELSAGDLEVREVAEDVVPADAVTDPDRLVGRTLVAPLSRGSVLTELSVLSDRPIVAEGKSIAPLRIADETVVGLLHVGDRVDVIASDPESGTGAEVIAEDVRVVTIPRSSADPSGLDPGGVDPLTLLLVEVTPDQATLLADAATTSQLSVLLG